MPDPRLPHDTQPPHPQPADPHELGPQRQRLADVAPAADAAVVHDVRLVAYGSHDVLQRIQRGDRAIDLPARVVAHHDAVDAELDGPLRVRDALDAFKAEGLAAADGLPRLDQPGHLVPVVGTAVPHVVDPHGARALGLLLGINARGREALLEDRVREPQVGADAAVEGVVPLRDVVVAPAELPGVGGEDANVEAGLEGARQQADGQFVVVRQIQLVEAAAGTVGGGDVLDGRGARGREAVGQVELLGDFGNWELTLRVVDLVDADGGEADGRGDFVPEDCGAAGADVGVDELAGDDLVAVEGLSVGEVGVGGAGVGGCVEPGRVRSRSVRPKVVRCTIRLQSVSVSQGPRVFQVL